MPSPTGQDALILLVDDDPAILSGVADLLDLFGYRVVAVSSAADALAVLEEQRPDLVLSDVMMPGMDGFEFYDAVRSNPEWVPIPFIFLTARGQQQDIQRGHRLGADAYLTKPFEPKSLRAAIEGRLRRARSLDDVIRADVDAIKQHLLTVFGHELRTPLSYIYTNINMLRDEYDTLPRDSVDQILDIIQSGSERLFYLVEDLLLMERIDNGLAAQEIVQGVARLPLGKIIEDVMQEHQHRAHLRNTRLSMSLSDGVDAVEVSYYIKDALKRLVDNAIKFSAGHEGHVLISAFRDSDGIKIAVRDDGIGIESGDLEILFENFEQLHRDVYEQQGLGIGLALARSLVRLNDGDISIESAPGEGSTFTVTLPDLAEDSPPL